jgi:hypothetical protein
MAAPERVMCQACNGMGYSRETAPEMELQYDRELGGNVEVRTIKQGSGCIRCLGVGYVASRNS